ncbi:hypothetical protein FRC15_006934, partial [Serendipita sp. 397]
STILATTGREVRGYEDIPSITSLHFYAYYLLVTAFKRFSLLANTLWDKPNVDAVYFAIPTGVANDPWFDAHLLRSRNVPNSYTLALRWRGRKYKYKFGSKDSEVPLQYRAVCFIKGAIAKFKCYIDYSEYLLPASGELPNCLSNVKCVFTGSAKMGVEYTLNVSTRLKLHSWNE